MNTARIVLHDFWHDELDTLCDPDCPLPRLINAERAAAVRVAVKPLIEFMGHSPTCPDERGDCWCGFIEARDKALALTTVEWQHVRKERGCQHPEPSRFGAISRTVCGNCGEELSR